MIEFTGFAELLLLGVLTLIAMAIIVFPDEGSFLFIGPLLLGLILSIPYLNQENLVAQEFVLKRFKEGKSIECGLWRGERTLVNPNAGWNYLPDTGFVKDDQIRSDLGLCGVIGEEAPTPSVGQYALLFMLEFMASFGLRYILRIKSGGQTDERLHN